MGESQSNLLSSLSQLISTTPKDKPPRMPEPSLDSTFSESSTSQPLPLSLTVSTDKPSKRRTSLSSISVEVLSMSPSSPLRKVSSRSKLPTVTPISVEKISITNLSISALPTSRRNLVSISPRTPELSEDSEPNARRPREFFLPHILPQSSARLLLKVRITTPTSPELSSRNSAWISSENVCHQSRTSSRTPVLAKVKSTRSFSSVDPPVSQRFNPCFLISSTERLLTNPSTQMRPSLTVLPSKLLSLPDKVTLRLKNSYSSMSPHFPWVSRLTVASCLILSR